jgi:hypothetical protein
VKLKLEKKECNFPASPAFLDMGSTAEMEAAAFSSVYRDLHSEGRMDLETLYATDAALLHDVESGRTAAGLTRKDTLSSLLEEQSSVSASADADADSEDAADADADEEDEDAADMDMDAEADEDEEDQEPAQKSTPQAFLQTTDPTAAGGEAAGPAPTETPENAPHPNPNRFGDKVKNFPGKPTYYSMQSRCNALATRVETMFAQMTTTFQEKLCNCMGCCVEVNQPTCFFPITTTIGYAPGVMDAVVDAAEDSEGGEEGAEAFLFFLESKTNVLRNRPVPTVEVRSPAYWANRRKESPWYKAKVAREAKEAASRVEA